MASYWDKVLTKRIGRRRALAATGGLAIGAAILSACGGDEEGGGGQPTSPLLYKTEDTSKQAKHGGTFRGTSAADPLNWDYYNFDANSQSIHTQTAIHLLRFRAGHMEPPALVIENELAEDYEYSGDKLTLTFKLNPKAKFAPKSSKGFHGGVPASVFDRQIDADDVAFSFERLSQTVSATTGGRGELFNAVAKVGPVLSWSAIDKSTFQLKLDHPSSALLTALGNDQVSYPAIIPKEGRGGAIDFLKTQISGGPYYIESFEPSVSIVMKRNPYYEALFPDLKVPYFDVIDLPRVVDPAQVLAQFRTGNLFNGPGFAPLDDRLKLKQDIPDLLMWTQPVAAPEKMYFGQKAGSSFADYRVRQAMSLAWDRDTFIKVSYSTDKLEAQGIPADIRWATFMSNADFGPPGGRFRGEWLDPKSKEFGPNAKFMLSSGTDRDAALAEAKKLVKAATGKDVIEFEHDRVPFFPTQSFDIMDGILSSSTVFKPVQKALNFNEFLQKRATNPAGDWDAVMSVVRYVPPDPVTYMFAYLDKDGGLFGGYSGESNLGAGANTSGTDPVRTAADGKPLILGKGDPTMNALIDKMYGEFDEKKRLELIFEAQRYHAKMFYAPDYPGGCNTLFVGWPAVENRLGWQSGGLSHFYRHIWLNEAKAPIKKA